jgi:hypothetical protein
MTLAAASLLGSAVLGLVLSGRGGQLLDRVFPPDAAPAMTVAWERPAAVVRGSHAEAPRGDVGARESPTDAGRLKSSASTQTPMAAGLRDAAAAGGLRMELPAAALAGAAGANAAEGAASAAGTYGVHPVAGTADAAMRAAAPAVATPSRSTAPTRGVIPAVAAVPEPAAVPAAAPAPAQQAAAPAPASAPELAPAAPVTAAPGPLSAPAPAPAAAAPLPAPVPAPLAQGPSPVPAPAMAPASSPDPVAAAPAPAVPAPGAASTPEIATAPVAAPQPAAGPLNPDNFVQTSGHTVVDDVLGVSVVEIQGGSLGGHGTIVGMVTIGPGGALTPGNSPGILTIGGLDHSGVLEIEIAGIDNSDPDHPQFDVVNVSGTATFQPGSTLHFVLYDTYSPTHDDDFTFLMADALVGLENITHFAITGLTPGFGYQVYADEQAAGLHLRFYAIGQDSYVHGQLYQGAPAPSSLALATLGFLLLASSRRRHGRLQNRA